MGLFNLHYKYQVHKRGFTLLELVLVIALAAAVATWSLSGIIRYAAHQEIDRAVTEIITLTNETRQRTIAAETDTQFGLRFATSTVTRFEGVDFDEEAPSNVVLPLANVELQIDFSDDSNQIVFSRLRGVSSATGTVTVTHSRSDREVLLEVLPSGNMVRP